MIQITVAYEDTDLSHLAQLINESLNQRLPWGNPRAVVRQVACYAVTAVPPNPSSAQPYESVGYSALVTCACEVVE